MGLIDSRGVPVSTASRAALDRYEAAAEKLHSYVRDPLAEIDAALAEDPGFVMGHCLRGTLMALATEKAAEAPLRQSVEAAEALAAGANERERGHIAALRAWLDGDFAGAVDGWGRVAEAWPRDGLALQAAHLGDFYLGHTTLLRDRIARALPAWDEAVPGYGYVLGMHAFGLEETGDYRTAEATGRRAVALQPRDPWAIHAVAHVLEMEGRLPEGVDWLSGRSGDWAPDNMFAFHNWWHLALYHLDLGDTETVLRLYDEAIRPRPSPVALETLDATALLWRLHLRGVDGGARWADLADTWAPMAEDGYYAFNDMHAMMAFVATGRDADAGRLLAAQARRADSGGTNAAMTAEVGLPVCRALRAFGAGDYATAVELLGPVRAVAHRFGGSHAQRDVLNLTLVEAALRGGQADLARSLAAERVEAKPGSPFNWRLTVRALRLAGDEAGAVAAEKRACG
ncbi:tetratricopeptide repeat protein [Inquilinus limosus]|uniref:Tetratricopeptide repeat protein 38 n=1 Tax=Inquilinus limosus TaxID=171674 RepID=A0A211ZP15_9PROT|nr:tetratricopeptide repeat protein [Inquilinus limosus]OWJ66837.1 peptidylprolyl isomerase [Inquilinus limosus]